MSRVQLGATYSDIISGFTGVAIGHVDYITGCNQTLLQPRSDESRVKLESQWFDDQRLRYDETENVIVIDNGTTPGCDKPAPRI
jgi:hypothetical protein